MKNLLNFLKNYVLVFVEKPIIDQEKVFIHELLDKFYTKSPKACTATVAGLYLALDSVAEEIVAKTETKLDDNQVAMAKAELEAFAAEKGFILTNLDQD